MKRISLVAMTAVAGLFSTNVLAADLGGDCCADLEERVAELEATTARKGNRKVSLTIYGQVTTALMFWDGSKGPGDTARASTVGPWSEDNLYVVDPQTSGTRFGFKGSAAINSDWSAGYHFELQWQTADATRVRKDNPNGFDTPEFRQAHWWVKSKSFGKIRVGQADMASSGISEINVANSNIADGMSSSAAGAAIINSDIGASVVNNFEFNRQNIIRYDTPTFGGFFFSAAYGEDDVWDVALRYAGEHHRFKMAAGISYGQYTSLGFNIGNGAYELSSGNRFPTGSRPLRGGFPDEVAVGVLGGGLSIMDTGSGLFFTGSAGVREARETVTCAFTPDNAPNCGNEWFYFLSGGIERKYLALGKTTLFAMGGENETAIDQGSQFWGLGAVQKIDAAAMDMFISYRDYFELTTGPGVDYAEGDFQTVVGGARIRF